VEGNHPSESESQ